MTLFGKVGWPPVGSIQQLTAPRLPLSDWISLLILSRLSGSASVDGLERRIQRSLRAAQQNLVSVFPVTPCVCQGSPTVFYLAS